jgi:chorismate-pyruvate lyase
MPALPYTISTADSESHRGELEALVRWFDLPLGNIGEFAPLSAAELPADPTTMLVHDRHMTVRVEAYHKSLVDVQVLAEHREDHVYGRQILLARRSDGEVVQYGIMRIDMRRLSEKARREVETHSAPLGRVLIRHKALRDVELIALWRIRPAAALVEHLGVPANAPIYGRSARILLDKQPAVELLEIVKV